MPSPPKHGFCSACLGPIPEGQFWTLTKKMNRVHHNQDHCVEHQLKIADGKRQPKQFVRGRDKMYRIRQVKEVAHV